MATTPADPFAEAFAPSLLLMCPIGTASGSGARQTFEAYVLSLRRQFKPCTTEAFELVARAADLQSRRWQLTLLLDAQLHSPDPIDFAPDTARHQMMAVLDAVLRSSDGLKLPAELIGSLANAAADYADRQIEAARELVRSRRKTLTASERELLSHWKPVDRLTPLTMPQGVLALMSESTGLGDRTGVLRWLLEGLVRHLRFQSERAVTHRRDAFRNNLSMLDHQSHDLAAIAQLHRMQAQLEKRFDGVIELLRRSVARTTK